MNTKNNNINEKDISINSFSFENTTHIEDESLNYSTHTIHFNDPITNDKNYNKIYTICSYNEIKGY